MRRDGKTAVCGIEKKRKLKTLLDYEYLLREIRLAHVEQDKDKLDALFTELYASTMVSCKGEGDEYKIQNTPFRSLVLTQYNRIACRIEMACDSFEDVMQSVMMAIYDGSVFFRGLQKCDPDKRAARLNKILNNTSCWWQINDYICDHGGNRATENIRNDIGIFHNQRAVIKNGKTCYHYVNAVSMQRELDVQVCGGQDRLSDEGSQTPLQQLVNEELSYDPIKDATDEKEQSPMEEIAIKVAQIVYRIFLDENHDEKRMADFVRCACQTQHPVPVDMRVEKIETFSSMANAQRSFTYFLRKVSCTSKILAKLSDDDLRKFADELDLMFSGTENFETQKNIITACLTYIKEKQDEAVKVA